MSSLAMFAATIDDNSNITLGHQDDNLIQQKRQHKKTQRKYSKLEGFSPKVNSVLQQIHNSTDDDDDHEMGGFHPPPNAISMGTERVKNQTNPQPPQPHGPLPNDDSSTKLDVNHYASNYVPPPTMTHYVQPTEYGSPNVLLQKLNYMITLLEEQQDEKTNNVTEEVILYSFLGIFMIFMADTFVRAGKYTR